MQKFYVLDTNIPLDMPLVINKFRDCTVVIPMVLLQEVDNFKKDNELGKNARLFSNFIDKLSENNYYIEENNVHVDIVSPYGEEVYEMFNDKCNDNKIIQCALDIKDAGADVELFSNDILVRTKSRAIGITASGFTLDEPENALDMIYSGFKELQTDADVINTIFRDKYISVKLLDEIKVYPHMFLIFKNGSQSAVGKVSGNCDYVELLDNVKDLEVSGIRPRNIQQRMALELLLDDEIPLVTMVGKAGSGKTLLALATGLYKVEDMQNYRRMILTKPVVALGKDIGYLPGEKEEKLGPWMQSYKDNLEVLLKPEKVNDLDDLMADLKLQIEAMTYMRGRTLPEQFIIIDEAQNLTKHEIKSIVTRAGEDAKIIVMGDPEQCDAQHLDSINNGLTYLVNKFKDQKVAGHIKFMKTERSTLASIAADIL